LHKRTQKCREGDEKEVSLGRKDLGWWEQNDNRGAIATTTTEVSRTGDGARDQGNPQSHARREKYAERVV